MWYSELIRPLVEQRLAERAVGFEEYAARFDDAARLHAKSLVILMAPVFAFLLWALFGRSRRYYVEHLVFALHFFTFHMILASIMDLVVAP